MKKRAKTVDYVFKNTLFFLILPFGFLLLQVF